MRDNRSEKAIMNEALVEVSALPDTLGWRNNTGTAWQGERVAAFTGQMIRVEPGMLILRGARPITFGLPGSGDLMGLTRGTAWALEGKTATGAMRETQRKFAAAFERAGGVYGVFRSPDQAVAIITDRILRGE